MMKMITQEFPRVMNHPHLNNLKNMKRVKIFIEEWLFERQRNSQKVQWYIFGDIFNLKWDLLCFKQKIFARPNSFMASLKEF